MLGLLPTTENFIKLYVRYLYPLKDLCPDRYRSPVAWTNALISGQLKDCFKAQYAKISEIIDDKEDEAKSIFQHAIEFEKGQSHRQLFINRMRSFPLDFRKRMPLFLFPWQPTYMSLFMNDDPCEKAFTMFAGIIYIGCLIGFSIFLSEATPRCRSRQEGCAGYLAVSLILLLASYVVLHGGGLSYIIVSTFSTLKNACFISNEIEKREADPQSIIRFSRFLRFFSECDPRSRKLSDHAVVTVDDDEATHDIHTPSANNPNPRDESESPRLIARAFLPD